MLKKVRNNAYVAKKLNAVIAAKKHSITAVAKICCISRKALTAWIKHLKFGREEKLFAPPQRRRKTILNQSQREQVEVWIEENPNITIKEMKIRIQEKFGLANLQYTIICKERNSHISHQDQCITDKIKVNKRSLKKNLNETIVFSKTNDKRLKWYYQLKGVSLYIDALEV